MHGHVQGAHRLPAGGELDAAGQHPLGEGDGVDFWSGCHIGGAETASDFGNRVGGRGIADIEDHSHQQTCRERHAQSRFEPLTVRSCRGALGLSGSLDRLFIFKGFGAFLLHPRLLHLLPFVPDLFPDLFVGLVVRWTGVGGFHEGIGVARCLTIEGGHHRRDQ